MVSIASRVPRRGSFHQWLIGAGMAVAVAAVLPIVAGIGAALLGGPSAEVSAFAASPAGDYAIVARQGERADTVYAVAAAGGREIPIAVVEHLPGFSPVGAVSPDGRQLALVVAEAGTPASPGASLLVVGLETGAVARLLTGIDYLQPPVWDREGRSVVVSRASSAGAELLRAELASAGVTSAGKFENVLGAYPVAFDTEGRLVTVVIDGEGSLAMRDGAPLARISAHLTRNWVLSPDGIHLAFIEANLDAGLRYLGRVALLVPGGAPEVSAQADGGRGQALGAAWHPAVGGPSFGLEPATAPGGVAAAAAANGFDVPLAFSANGRLLAAQHWSGQSFAVPGKMELQLQETGAGGSRTSLAGFGRFFGWAAR